MMRLILYIISHVELITDVLDRGWGGTSSRLPPVWLLREVERGRDGGKSDRLGPHGRYTREQSLANINAQRLWKSKPQPKERKTE